MHTKKTMVNNNPAAMSTAKRKSQPVKRTRSTNHHSWQMKTRTGTTHVVYLNVQKTGARENEQG